MTDGISFTLDDDLARSALVRIRGTLVSPADIFHAIGSRLIFSTRQNFEHERTPDGAAWKRLSPRTAAQRIGSGRSSRKRGYSNILIRSGLLQDSVSYNVLSDGVEWGTNSPYGRIHQLGGRVEKRERLGKVSLATIRTKGGGVRTRFVKPGSKGAVERAVKIRAHSTVIPARPYLGISTADREEIPRIVTKVLEDSARS